MRLTRVAAFAALSGLVLTAQAPARQATHNDALEADLHYAAGSGTWVSTNKPAFVAVFDVSRTRLSQVYPTFSAQAAYPVSNQDRLKLVYDWRRDIGAWPHTLLLVASTAPLRVGSPLTTNARLNHLLVQRHLTDLQTDTGIETIIDMIRSVDPKAEIAYDRMDGIQARAAQ